jgi:hypothetical protein
MLRGCRFSIRPMTGSTERGYITTMIGEIREKLALDLEPHSSLEWGPSPGQSARSPFWWWGEQRPQADKGVG